MRMMTWIALVSAVLLFVLVLQAIRGQPERKQLRAYEEWRGFVVYRKMQQTYFQKTSDWLQKKGADYHFGTSVKPAGFIALRAFAACIGAVIGMAFSVWLGMACMVAFFFLPNVLIWYLNNRDNEHMLPEIRLIYHALEIQIRAGVYVADALTECYAGVQDKRLRVALLDLAGAITMKADIYEALEQFQSHFDNRYIDSLCITILQALESGQAVDLLADIAEQVKDMEVNVLARKKGSLDRSVTFYQLGILASILGMVLYACVTQMFTAALSF